MGENYYATATKEGTRDKLRRSGEHFNNLGKALDHLAAEAYTKEIRAAVDAVAKAISSAAAEVARAQARQDIKDAEALIAQRRKQLGEDGATQD